MRANLQEINQTLDIIRERKTVIDQPLVDVLHNSNDQANQRRAKSLVSQIQRHYEQVRSISLRNVRTPGVTLDTVLHRLHQFDAKNASARLEPLPSRPTTADDRVET
jgi:predicted glycosyltransferase